MDIAERSSWSSMLCKWGNGNQYLITIQLITQQSTHTCWLSSFLGGRDNVRTHALLNAFLFVAPQALFYYIIFLCVHRLHGKFSKLPAGTKLASCLVLSLQTFLTSVELWLKSQPLVSLHPLLWAWSFIGIIIIFFHLCWCARSWWSMG